MRKHISVSAVLVVLVAFHRVVPAEAQGVLSVHNAISADNVTFIEGGKRTAASRAPLHGSRFSVPMASAGTTAETITPAHNSGLTFALPRTGPQPMLHQPILQAVQVAQSRKRPGLWAALGAVAGAGLGALYASAGHPGLPHAGGDTPDEVLYVPLFGGFGAVVAWLLSR